MIKGFVMNDDLLKASGGGNWHDSSRTGEWTGQCASANDGDDGHSRKATHICRGPNCENYLYEDELGTLNRLVSAYLDLAELQVMRKKPMYMKDWIARLDDYLRMTDSEVLQNAGTVSHALAEQKARQEYEKYKQLHSHDLTPVEQAFLESVEATAKCLEGKK